MPARSTRRPTPRLAGWLAGLLLIMVGVATNLVSDQLPAAWGDWIKANPIPVGVGFVLLALAAIWLGERAQRQQAPVEPAIPAGPTATQGSVAAGRDVDQSGPRSEVHGGSVETLASFGTVYGNVTVTPPAAPAQVAAAGGLVAPVGGRVSNLPPANPDFTGRQELLERLHQQLRSSGRAVVVAAHGLGGVGKTQLVLAYAYEHAGEYPLVWWIPAETDLAATSVLAALAPLLGVAVEADLEATVAAVLQALGQRPGAAGAPGWLLVFDNAEDPQRLRRLLPPGGAGRVLITSRNPAWGGIAHRLPVDVLPEEEAVALLLRRTHSSDRAAAAVLARELDGLPLALAQVAGYCEQTGLSLPEYLDAYRRRHEELLAKGQPVDYPATVATTWQLGVEQLAGRSPAAVQLLRLAAFLAPEGIPLGLLAADPQQLPDELSFVVQDEAALEATVGALVGLSLMARERGGLRLHLLVQAATRASLPTEQAGRWAERAVRLVLAAFPTSPEDPRSWPQAAGLLAHALAAADHAETRQAAPEATARLRNQVGIYLLSRVELTAAREQLERAVRLMEVAYGPDYSNVAVALGNLASVLRELGDLSAAREALERTRRLLEAAYGPDHPEVAKTLGNLGSVLREMGDLSAAREALEHALHLLEAAYGPDHPEVAITLGNLGIVLLELGELSAARERLERSMHIDEVAYGPDHPNVGITLGNLAAIVLELRDLPAAREVLERSLRLKEDAYGPDHPDVGRTLTNLGLVLLELGELAAARERLERALRVKEAAYGPDHPEVAKTLGNLGRVLVELGELPAAREALERAVGVCRRILGIKHPDTRWAQRLLDDLP